MAEEQEKKLEMVLVDPEGNEHIFEPVLTLGVRGRDFIVLQPQGEGGEAELQILGFHAGPNDEIILDDIDDDELYYEVARQAEAILNDEMETEEYLLDNGTIPEEEMAEYRRQAYEEEVREEEEDYCYEDEDGNLFIYGEDGRVIYLNEYGEPIEDEN
ncbi:MAG: DUF1292 domain-containing protein [Lachnospiraceae bacterium]|nr:DUF1292 domain-containing protein [Lachnospiraceae bacterium]